MTNITYDDMRTLAQRQLEEEKRRCSGDTSVPIDLLTKKGNVVHTILAVAEEMHADLIVVGMTGTEKNIRRSFGSAATTLSRKTPVPLLVIPEGARFTPPVVIALAEDVIKGKEDETPKVVRELLGEFHAKLFLIRVFNKQSGEVIEILHESANGHRTIGAFSPLYEIPASKNVAHAPGEFYRSEPDQHPGDAAAAAESAGKMVSSQPYKGNDLRDQHSPVDIAYCQTNNLTRWLPYIHDI